jgi:hypothetical protein
MGVRLPCGALVRRPFRLNAILPSASFAGTSEDRVGWGIRRVMPRGQDAVLAWSSTMNSRITQRIRRCSLGRLGLDPGVTSQADAPQRQIDRAKSDTAHGVDRAIWLEFTAVGVCIAHRLQIPAHRLTDHS